MSTQSVRFICVLSATKLACWTIQVIVMKILWSTWTAFIFSKVIYGFENISAGEILQCDGGFQVHLLLCHARLPRAIVHLSSDMNLNFPAHVYSAMCTSSSRHVQETAL